MSEILVGALDEAGAWIIYKASKIPEIADIQSVQLIYVA
jgi:hypothetical protein